VNNPFMQLAHDTITICSASGDHVAGPFRVSFGKGKCSLWDMSVTIVPGLMVKRQLPNNGVEEYIIEDPGFSSGLPPSIPPHYELKLRRKDAIPKPPTSVTYNFHGPNARVNIGSYDNSNNVVYHEGSATDLFAELRTAIEVISVESDRKRLLEHVAEMEAAAGTITFLDKYRAFMQDVAAHITVIAPLLPALASLLPHH
jgi:hypothetical protein